MRLKRLFPRHQNITKNINFPQPSQQSKWPFFFLSSSSPCQAHIIELRSACTHTCMEKVIPKKLEENTLPADPSTSPATFSNLFGYRESEPCHRKAGGREGWGPTWEGERERRRRPLLLLPLSPINFLRAREHHHPCLRFFSLLINNSKNFQVSLLPHPSSPNWNCTSADERGAGVIAKEKNIRVPCIYQEPTPQEQPVLPRKHRREERGYSEQMINMPEVAGWPNNTPQPTSYAEDRCSSTLPALFLDMG